MLANLYSRSTPPHHVSRAWHVITRTSGGLVGRPSCNRQWPPTRPACARPCPAPPLPMVPTPSHDHTLHVRVRVRAPGGSPLTWAALHTLTPSDRTTPERAPVRPHIHVWRAFLSMHRASTPSKRKNVHAREHRSFRRRARSARARPTARPKTGIPRYNFLSPLRGSSVRTAPRSAPRAPPNWTKSTRMTLSTS